MYRIYIDNHIDSSDYELELLYSPSIEDEDAEGCEVIDISVEKELNSAGSASFTVPVTNPRYGDIKKLRTMVFILWDADLLWVGRVLGYSYDISRSKMVNCEGCAAFLNDIQVKPFVYSGATSYRTLEQHLTRLLSEYNSRCSPKRSFQSISTDLPEYFSSDEVYKVSGVTSYMSVKDAIDDILAVDSSVAMGVVYEGLGMPTLKIGKTPFDVIDNYIQFGWNMLSFGADEDGSGIFTSVIPLGDDNITVEDETHPDYAMNSSMLTQEYGIIEKTVQIDGIKNREKLRMAGENILHAAEAGEHPTLTIKAVDMKWVDISNNLPDHPEFIEVGDAVPVIFPGLEINRWYMCTKISFDLEKPDDTTYTLEYIELEVSGKPEEEIETPDPDTMPPAYIKDDNTLAGYVLGSSKSIDASQKANTQRPDSITASSNEVVLNYPGYKVTYQADGTGNTRSNVRVTVTNEEE